ncbi:hypothetical protein QL285_083184 [Trifolium repens]|nr:hypothetical protein QL285_083184 [Trifolium repens]
MNHDDMVIDINAMLDKAEPPFGAKHYCIYKTPLAICRLNEDAYTPKVISIGPFHHRLSHVQNMERHKLIFFKAFLQHAGTTTQPLIKYIESIIPDFRRCYSETLDFTDQELVKLILIDSGFIIELFYGFYYHDQRDYFLLEPWLHTTIVLDLVLLENQLPFFILEKIFNICFGAQADICPFRELTFNYFQIFNEYNCDYHNNRDISIKHFTDLIRIFHLQLEKRPDRTEGPTITKHFYSVTELFEAGVTFKVNTKSKCLLELRFLGGVLEIPELTINDWTEILFRNMIALEECHYYDESYITDYIFVLEFLINTERDVDILVEKEILVNVFGDSDSVAKVFNRLCKNVSTPDFNHDYSVICNNLDGFYRDPWHKLKATLRRDYGSTPWQTAASAAGILLLFLSLLQSVCSVLQIVQQ